MHSQPHTQSRMCAAFCTQNRFPEIDHNFFIHRVEFLQNYTKTIDRGRVSRRKSECQKLSSPSPLHTEKANLSMCCSYFICFHNLLFGFYAETFPSQTSPPPSPHLTCWEDAGTDCWKQICGFRLPSPPFTVLPKLLPHDLVSLIMLMLMPKTVPSSICVCVSWWKRVEVRIEPPPPRLWWRAANFVPTCLAAGAKSGGKLWNIWTI